MTSAISSMTASSPSRQRIDARCPRRQVHQFATVGGDAMWQAGQGATPHQPVLIRKRLH